MWLRIKPFLQSGKKGGADTVTLEAHGESAAAVPDQAGASAAAGAVAAAGVIGLEQRAETEALEHVSPPASMHAPGNCKRALTIPMQQRKMYHVVYASACTLHTLQGQHAP